MSESIAERLEALRQAIDRLAQEGKPELSRQTTRCPGKRSCGGPLSSATSTHSGGSRGNGCCTSVVGWRLAMAALVVVGSELVVG